MNSAIARSRSRGLAEESRTAGRRIQPLELFVGNAGTAARFLAAFVCLGNGVYRLHGVPRMHERPQAALFQALRELGYRVESPNDKLPAIIYGGGFPRPASDERGEGQGEGNLLNAPPHPGPLPRFAAEREKIRACKVSIEESSQFASALLLCAKVGGWKVEVVGENAEESPYVAMTSKMIEAFPHHGGKFQIEPDASSGSYFLAAGKVVEQPEFLEYSDQWKMEVKTKLLSDIFIAGWPESDWQVDGRFEDFLSHGALLRIKSELKKAGKLYDQKLIAELEKDFKSEVSRMKDLGDSIMTRNCYIFSGIRCFTRTRIESHSLYRLGPPASSRNRTCCRFADGIDQVRRKG